MTVNVNFPESAVQKATDDYVRDLYRAKEKNKAPAAVDPSGKPQSRFEIFASAWADEMSLEIRTEETQSILARQKARINEIDAQKGAGFIGENKDGLLSLRGEPPALLKGKLSKLIDQENDDRRKLYGATLNELKKKSAGASMEQVVNNFKRSFRSYSPPGTWVEGTDGSWSKQ